METKRGGYEAHITCALEHATAVEELGATQGWVFSQISGCPLLGQGTYCYLTSYNTDARPLLYDLVALVARIELAGVPVLRSKMEHIVFDTRTGVNEIWATLDQTVRS